MGSCYAKRACDIARAEIGYQGDGKWCKYSEDLDSISYFNFPKNGAADWCSIFVNWCVWKACIEPSADDDPEGAKWTAYYMMCEPSSSSANCAAGCTQAAGYFKAADQWTDNPQCGDQVFYRNSSGSYYHTGILVDWDWDNDVLYVVEGNTGGSQVLMREYSFRDIGGKIAGFGRPRYDGYEPPYEKEPDHSKDDSKPQPTPTPEPTPAPEPVGVLYTVHTNSGDGLRIREEANTDSSVIGMLDNGESFRSDEVVDGESIGDITAWVAVNGGYVSGRYLEPTPSVDSPLPEPDRQGYPGEFPTIPDRGYFQKGDEGEEVKKLQSFLEWLIPGCLSEYGIDGEIGDETLYAVKCAQELLGAEVDGFYGPETEAAAKAYKK